jgi:hypothetical protein
MKILIIAISMLACSLANLQAQVYPITNNDEFNKLALVTNYYAKMKELIFVNNAVRAEVFLYFAMVQGMTNDKLPASVALSVATEAEGPNFVPNCKICAATKQAFEDYAKYSDVLDNESNPYPSLTDKDKHQRHQDIRALTDKYTTALLAQLKLTDAEGKKLESYLAVMAEDGMVKLQQLDNNDFGYSGCPSCKGATHQK